MKPLILVFSLVLLLLPGCSADSTILGSGDESRRLAPTEDCNINTKLC